MTLATPKTNVLPPGQMAGTSIWREVVGIALDSLLANKARSILTMLGVIIGVASVVALVALGAGASNAVTSEITAIGTNMLSVMPGSPQNQGPGNTLTAQTLTLDDARAVEALNLPIRGIAPQFSTAAQIVAPAADKNATIVGTTANYKLLHSLTLTYGTFFDENQTKSAVSVIVLGNTLASDLFGKGQAVGQFVRVRESKYRVIGVLKATGGSGFGSVDEMAFVPITTAHQRFPNARTPDGNAYLVSTITLSVKEKDNIDAVQSRISILLRERHHLAANGSDDDFIVLNQATFLSTLTTITNVLTTFLAAIAGISLFVGGIGIMNIMLVSVTERTREIGLRKAVGAQSRDILMQFLFEAIAISLTGGVIGLLVGSAAALLVTLSGVVSASVSFSAAVLALGFSVAVGVFFGIYPARRAARLNPIDALRYE